AAPRTGPERAANRFHPGWPRGEAGGEQDQDRDQREGSHTHKWTRLPVCEFRPGSSRRIVEKPRAGSRMDSISAAGRAALKSDESAWKNVTLIVGISLVFIVVLVLVIVYF